MSAGFLFYQGLGAFCAVFLVWLTFRLLREMRGKGGANLIICLLMGALCCLLASSVVSYLAMRTIIFDWTLQAGPAAARVLRLYLFTALMYLLAFILSMPTRDLFKRRMPPKAMPLSAMLMVTLLALATMVSEWTGALKGQI